MLNKKIFLSAKLRISCLSNIHTNYHFDGDKGKTVLKVRNIYIILGYFYLQSGKIGQRRFGKGGKWNDLALQESKKIFELQIIF